MTTITLNKGNIDSFFEAFSATKPLNAEEHVVVYREEEKKFTVLSCQDYNQCADGQLLVVDSQGSNVTQLSLAGKLSKAPNERIQKIYNRFSSLLTEESRERLRQEMEIRSMKTLTSDVEEVCALISAHYKGFTKLPEKTQLVIALGYLNTQSKCCLSEVLKEDFVKTICANLDNLNLLKTPNDYNATTWAGYNANAQFELIRPVITGDQPLTITASKEEILRTFLQYNGAILLRPLQSENLVIGCGLGTCTSDTCSKSWFSSKKEAAHPGDTVDSNLAMNPSVVCSWGYGPQMDMFKNRYTMIYDEGSVLALSASKDLFWSSCSKSLNHNASQSVVLIWDHVFNSSDPNLSPADEYSLCGYSSVRAWHRNIPVRVYSFKEST